MNNCVHHKCKCLCSHVGRPRHIHKSILMRYFRLFFLIYCWMSFGESVYAQSDMEAVHLANKAISLSRQHLDSAMIMAKKAFLQAEESPSERAKGRAWAALAACYWRKGNFTEALEASRRAIGFAQNIADDTTLALCHKHLGIIAYRQGQTDSAIVFFREGLRHYEQLKDSSGIAASLNNLAIAHKQQGDYAHSIQYNFTALAIKEFQRDSLGMANSYNNIATLYDLQKNRDKALSYNLKALKIRTEAGDKAGMATSHNNIGVIYFKLGELGKALFHQQQCMAIAEAIGDQVDTILACENMAAIYLKQKNYEKAHLLITKGLALANTVGEKSLLSSLSSTAAKYYYDQQAYTKAHEQAIKAWELAKEADALEFQRNALEQCYLASQQLGNYQQAFQFYQQYIALRDTIENQVNIRLTLAKDFEHQEEQLRLIHEQQEEQRVIEREKESIVKYALLGIGAVLFLLLITAFVAYKNKHKSLQVIAQQSERLQLLHRQVTEKNTALSAQYEEMRELQGFKEVMLGSIVHDLKNPLSVIDYYANKDHSTPMQRIARATGQMMQLVENILDIQRFEQAEVQLNASYQPLYPLANDALAAVSLWAQERKLQLNNHVDKNVKATIDESLIMRVLTNLLTNAIKHTPSDGQITLEVTQDGLRAKVSVIDSGHGIPLDKIDLLFKRFSRIEAKELGISHSTGLGLHFCKLAVEAHPNGQIEVTSEEGKGSVFSFWLSSQV